MTLFFKISKLKKFLKRKFYNLKIFKAIFFYKYGKKIFNDPVFKDGREKSLNQSKSKYKRTDVINKILSSRTSDTFYLEIGVRNPEDNFNFINSAYKYSVDPGLESEINKADFKLTSDKFFQLLREGKILSSDISFDVVFIDGLHLAEQVERDIDNALSFLKEDGFIILHDCNPPTEWHARESYDFINSPAKGFWNGTVWKSFLNKRFDKTLKSCCINIDWGVGVISKKCNIGNSIKRSNKFFEYKDLEENRKYYLNLVSFEEFFNLI